MKTPIYILLLVAMFFLMPTPFALAEAGGLTVDSHGMLLECDNKTRESHFYLMNAEKLGLSAEQIKQLRDIKGGCDKVCVVEKVRFRVAKVELAEILKGKDIDMALAREKIRLISTIQDSLRIIHLKIRVKAMMVLNEKQKEKAVVLSKSI